MVFGESFEEVAPEVLIPLSAWAVVRLAMAKLTVTVTFAELRLAFLFGWPRKRIRRSGIRSTTPVRDPLSDARAVRSSTIWNPRCRQGVLLVLVGGKSLTVGADEPDALISALNAWGCRVQRRLRSSAILPDAGPRPWSWLSSRG